MSRWETTSGLQADLDPARIWRCAYMDARAWPKWNAEIKRASLDRPLGLGAVARIVFRIYIEGPTASLWRRILGPAATRSLPGAQRAIVTLASESAS